MELVHAHLFFVFNLVDYDPKLGEKNFVSFAVRWLD